MFADVTILRPQTIEEVLDLLDEHGGEATVYGGATELVVAMKLGLTDVSTLIDLKGVPELADIMVDDDRLRIGAMATHRQIESDREIAAFLPSLCEIERNLANPRVRAIGSIGGNLAFGEPHSDPATFLVAVGATLECWSSGGGRRTIPAVDFLVGPFESVLRDDELLVEIDVPRPSPRTALAYRRFHLSERPAVTVAASLTSHSGNVDSATVVVGSACPTPTVVTGPVDLLLGGGIDSTSLLEEAGRAAGDEIDVEAGGDEVYLRNIVSVLTTRALTAAYADLQAREIMRPAPSQPPGRSWGRLLRPW